MKKRLGDYIQEYSVRNKSGEDIPVYSITNSQGFCRDYFSKEVASKDKTTYKIVPRGCFAYNPSRINVGSVDWQRDEERVIVSPLYNVFSVSPEIDQQYLYYYLKSSATLYRIKEVATGSVRDNLRLSMLYDFMIELPSLDVQRQIVSNLDLLASIIRQRNQQLTKLDELIKARFVPILDCTKVAIDEKIAFRRYGGVYEPSELTFTALNDDTKTQHTVALLKEIYYGSTPQKIAEAKMLRGDVADELDKFQKSLREYQEADGEDKIDAECLISMSLKWNKPFAAFKRWVIRDHFPELIKYCQ